MGNSLHGSCHPFVKLADNMTFTDTMRETEHREVIQFAPQEKWKGAGAHSVYLYGVHSRLRLSPNVYEGVPIDRSYQYIGYN